MKEYASHLCGKFTRVGLIEVDAAELRLMLFERSIAEAMQNTVGKILRLTDGFR